MDLKRHGFKGALAAGALAIVLAGPTTAHAQSVLRLVPQADLKILDTVQTTNNITSNHGYMIYDTLFALDSKLMPKPQMVESYTKSADGLTWTFKLRPGLKFHDGQPVTAKDAVASILRFSKRIPAGVTMMQFTKEIVATGPETFEIRLNKPFGLVLETLAGPENPLFITREADALGRPEHRDHDGRSAPAPSCSCARNGFPAARSSTGRTPTTGRGPTRPMVSPAPSSPRSIASSGW